MSRHAILNGQLERGGIAMKLVPPLSLSLLFFSFAQKIIPSFGQKFLSRTSTQTRTITTVGVHSKREFISH